MKAGYLDSAGFTTHRMYWHGVLSNTIYPDEEPLIDGAVRARWQQQPFGIVTWFAHGGKGSRCNLR
ncbi:MAG: hypothetical protein R2854_21915 [Caldilineaceae bacterium]